MKNNLIPYKGKHSISKITASIIVPQSFLKPEDLFQKINSQEKFNNYQKKGLLKATTFNINNIKNKDFDLSNEETTGFIFEMYNKTGTLQNIFKLENRKENQSLISFETREYNNWNDFKAEIDKNYSEFSDLFEFYIKAIFLNYKDEFKWNSDEEIPTKKIFNIDSELLNNKFLTSKNGSLLLMSQDTSDKPYPSEERTEISFNNDIKRIVIDHQYANSFKDYMSFNKMTEETNFSTFFEKAHSSNKEMLKDILTEKTQYLIGLK